MQAVRFSVTLTAEEQEMAPEIFIFMAKVEPNLKDEPTTSFLPLKWEMLNLDPPPKKEDITMNAYCDRVRSVPSRAVLLKCDVDQDQQQSLMVCSIRD